MLLLRRSRTLEGWVEQNLLELTKGKFRVLCSGRKNLVHHYGMRANLVESSSAEKYLGVLVAKLSMSSALIAKQGRVAWGVLAVSLPAG